MSIQTFEGRPESRRPLFRQNFFRLIEAARETLPLHQQHVNLNTNAIESSAQFSTSFHVSGLLVSASLQVHDLFQICSFLMLGQATLEFRKCSRKLMKRHDKTISSAQIDTSHDKLQQVYTLH